MSPPKAGDTAWTETVLKSFSQPRGAQPEAGLIADKAGNLYGTTYKGGANNDGMVFELSPPKVGATNWKETVLHSFNLDKGAGPVAGLVADGAGNLYGTTYYGGADDNGVAFELMP